MNSIRLIFLACFLCVGSLLAQPLKIIATGDMDTAMKRFNQSWMFDNENADAFWGFGLIMGRRGMTGDTEKSFNESIRFLEMANKRNPDNARIIVDLAYSHTVLGRFFQENNNLNANSEFEKAKDLYMRAERIEPRYPLIYSNWSVLDFYIGNYPSAKEKINKAVDLGFKPDVAYVKDLENKLKEASSRRQK